MLFLEGLPPCAFAGPTAFFVPPNPIPMIFQMLNASRPSRIQVSRLSVCLVAAAAGCSLLIVFRRASPLSVCRPNGFLDPHPVPHWKRAGEERVSFRFFGISVLC